MQHPLRVSSAVPSFPHRSHIHRRLSLIESIVKDIYKIS